MNDRNGRAIVNRNGGGDFANYDDPGAGLTDFGGPDRGADLARVEASASRAMAEVQAAMVVAQKFPRDERAAYTRVMRSCQRPRLAEQSQYAFPRGGQTVTGPTIRLAEALARAWGNLDFGIAEVERRDGESVMQAYCWDLESNVRSTRVFVVKHERQARGRVQRLTDPRDVYEMTANQGARRVRACILAVIPGDVVEDALDACNATLRKRAKDVPIQDRARKMAAEFDRFGVTLSQLETRIGHRLDSISEAELSGLRRIYAALRDGHSAPAEFFSPTPPKGEEPITLDDVAPETPAGSAPPKTRKRGGKSTAEKKADSSPPPEQQDLGVHADEPPDDYEAPAGDADTKS